MSDPVRQNHERVTRRTLFGRGAQGIGTLALASLMRPASGAGPSGGPTGGPGAAAAAHAKPAAKRMVCLWQGGGPSHLDLFDYKPTLARLAGQDIPDSVRGGTRLSTMSSGYKRWPAVPAIKPFNRYGQSGLQLSSLLPHTGAIADEVCVVRSMHTEAVNHAPGVTFFMTGSQTPGRPSLGAWLVYGLGSGTAPSW